MVPSNSQPNCTRLEQNNQVLFYTKDTIWTNPKQKIESFIVPANKCQTHTDLILQLGQKIDFDFSKWDKKKLKTCQTFLSRYLKGKRQMSFFEGWFLKDYHSLVYRDPIKDILAEGEYTFYHIYDKRIFEFKSFEYEKFSDLVTTFIEKNKPLKHYNHVQWQKGLSNLLLNKRYSFNNWKVLKSHEFLKQNSQISIDNENVKKNYEKSFDFLSNQINERSLLEPITFLYQKISDKKKLNSWFKFINLIEEKSFLTNFLNLTENQRNQFKQNEIDFFEKCTCKLDMLNFLNNSLSFYHRLCSWFLTNPISNFNIDKLDSGESHHIIPKYLQKKYNLKANVDVNFNLIKIPYLIHLLLHLIRTLEFRYIEDQLPIQMAYSHLHPNSAIKFTFKNMLDFITKYIATDENFSKKKKKKIKKI